MEAIGPREGFEKWPDSRILDPGEITVVPPPQWAESGGHCPLKGSNHQHEHISSDFALMTLKLIRIDSWVNFTSEKVYWNHI